MGAVLGDKEHIYRPVASFCVDGDVFFVQHLYQGFDDRVPDRNDAGVLACNDGQG